VTYPYDEETDEQYTQRMMDWYEVDTSEELVEIENSLSLAHDELLVSQLTERVKAGKKPNSKDIAYALRCLSGVAWPEELREYTAQLLLGDIHRPDRKSIISEDGEVLSHKTVLDDFRKDPYVKSVKFFVENGVKKSDAIEVISMASLLGMVSPGNWCLENCNESFVAEVRSRWLECANDDLEVELDKSKRKVDEIIYPRNR
jgi:hypothetical protein